MNIYRVRLTELGIDRRRVLSDEEKAEIRILYSTGEWSYKTLAEEFGVSKSLIRWIIKDEEYKKYLEKSREKAMNYYDKEKHNEYMRKYRKQKKEIVLQHLENKTI